MKKLIIVGLILLLVVGIAVGVFVFQNKEDENVKPINLSGVGNPDDYAVLAGTAAISGGSPSLIRFPNSFVFSDSTTTPTYASSDNTVDIGNTSSTPGTINQLVYVGGYTDYTFYSDLRGGSATSTFCVMPTWSYDGISYYHVFDDLTASTTLDLTGTSTIALASQAFCTDPGTATTSFAFKDSIPGAKYARFLIWGEDASTDPDDGVEGHIIVTLEDSSGNH